MKRLLILLFIYLITLSKNVLAKENINYLNSSGYIFITKWGCEGYGDGQFDFPVGIAVDSQGNVYVSDSGVNQCIKKFTSDGNFITKWGCEGYGDGQFLGPSDIAADSEGYVYVVDCSNDRIQKFDSNGNFITRWGNLFNRDQVPKDGGDFDYNSPRLYAPIGVAVDSEGNIFVTDASIGIKKFTSNGNLLEEYGIFDLARVY